MAHGYGHERFSPKDERGKNNTMNKQTQNNDYQSVKLTRSTMEAELGDDYKRCWAFAFKYATEELDFDTQVEKLSREFDLFKHHAAWFLNGANSILFKQHAKENQKQDISQKIKQQELFNYSKNKTSNIKQSENYVSELEMMSFLEDIEELSNDTDFSEFWEELSKLKQKVLEQQCATERDVLKIFTIRSLVESKKQERERYFDAYPVSTDVWENGYFDVAGEIIYN